MHVDEVDTDPTLVGRLLAAQFPQWADWPLTPVASTGTDHALYRLGAELVVRLPRIGWAIGQADKEREWLPRLAPSLPLAVPGQVAQGEPGEGYPWRWSVYRWLAGENAASGLLANPPQVARDLAGFILALQHIDPAGGPLAVEHNLRGAPLARRTGAGRRSGSTATCCRLQCASGRDTLSLWLEGAQRVIGVDISDVQIANARQLGAALQAPADWYRCDVLDTPHELDGVADLVCTGQGAVCWLHDLEAWAHVIYRLLKPGGVFHVLDDHPLTWLFEPDAETYVLAEVNYFNRAEHSQGWPSSYIGALDIPPERQAVKHERLWPIASVFQALRQSGLVVDYLGEHPEPYWDAFPRLKAELRGKIPMTFSMKAYRPKIGQ